MIISAFICHILPISRLSVFGGKGLTPQPSVKNNNKADLTHLPPPPLFKHFFLRVSDRNLTYTLYILGLQGYFLLKRSVLKKTVECDAGLF
jgi:hypothetical protein